MKLIKNIQIYAPENLGVKDVLISDSKIEKIDDLWYINDEIKVKNLILATGADISLIDEEYFDIRAVWGQKIDVKTSTEVSVNYHKDCSLSKSKKVNENINLVLNHSK